MAHELLAHVRQDENKSWHIHSLKEHLEGTAKLAQEFTEVFGNGDWGKAAALLHDLGKGSEKFQRDLQKETGYDAHIETLKGMKNHSTHGAIWVHDHWPHVGKILAYLIAGHHAGLPDWYHETGVGGNLEHRLSEEAQKTLPPLDAEWLKAVTAKLSPPSTPLCGRVLSQDEYDVFHLWVRILYSALVDADFLDTEEFMTPEKTAQRGMYPELEELKKRFDAHMEELTANAEDTDVNTLRQKILRDCRIKGKERSGFFSLSVPTGGGKTLSSMAFALEHAIIHEKQRIIMAIPYTSIIEQTAYVYKEIFGAENVIEHHSSLDPETETARSRLATENWDAPIIVTTNVQLFESLFAARSSACRKLHNIVNSIIILDEAQMFPPDYLKPILSIMNGLVQKFDISIVLCTATQPALVGNIGSGDAEFTGLAENTVCEIMPNPTELFKQFRRVIVEEKGKYIEWQELADELTEREQILCIVNTRRDCRELHACMPEDTLHLSGYMCGEHRSTVIAEIKRRLHEKLSVRVISTQLVEAGVDIDFPIVYRALTGFDSVAQAAGRCNREGKLGIPGQVYVFEPPRASPPGLLRKGESAGRDILAVIPKECAALTPSAFERYFRIFYSKVSTFDRKNIHALLVEDAPQLAFQFRDAARKFQLIDDQRQVAVVVRYHGEKTSSHDLIQKLVYTGPTKTLMRQLQRFTITIPESLFAEAQSCFESIHGIWCQQTDGTYDQRLGFVGLNINSDLFFC